MGDQLRAVTQRNLVVLPRNFSRRLEKKSWDTSRARLPRETYPSPPLTSVGRGTSSSGNHLYPSTRSRPPTSQHRYGCAAGAYADGASRGSQKRKLRRKTVRVHRHPLLPVNSGVKVVRGGLRFSLSHFWFEGLRGGSSISTTRPESSVEDHRGQRQNFHLTEVSYEVRLC